MSIDFSTITPIGLFALLIICTALIVVIFFLIRAIKSFRLKTENATIEIGKTIETNIASVRDSGIVVSRDIVKKQSNLAKHHIMTMSGDLRALIINKYELTKEEKDIVYLLITLFLSELKYQVLNNFTENHIGNNDIEIAEYAKIREREYTAFAKTFINEYVWLIPRYNFHDFLDDLPANYLYNKLFVIYKDGKELEQHIKGAR